MVPEPNLAFGCLAGVKQGRIRTLLLLLFPQVELRGRNLTFLRAMRLQLVADARIHTYRCLHWPLRLFLFWTVVVRLVWIFVDYLRPFERLEVIHSHGRCDDGCFWYLPPSHSTTAGV